MATPDPPPGLRPSSRRAGRIAAGVMGSACLLAYLLLRLPGWEPVALVAATLLPASLVLYGGDARLRASDLRRQRAAVEGAFSRSEHANRELKDRLAELVTLNEVGVAIGSTLDLDELLDRSLAAVVSHLRFDRALVLLVDDTEAVLAGGRSSGGTVEMERLVGELEVPLADDRSLLVALCRADGPMLFRDVDADPYEPNREFAAALEVTAFLGTPLVAKGRTVGILAVDNRLSGRDVAPGDGPLLFTLGNLIASAIDNARLYAEAEAHNRELERRVAERTAALATATEEASAARAAAEAASQTKSTFLSNVSHELRTPLTSVVGFSKLIRRRLDETIFPAVGGEDPRVARSMRQVSDNLDIIVAESDRLTALINDVLDLAKIEAGRFDWREVEIQPAELIGRATAATSALFDGEPALVVDVADDLPTIVGDPDRLIQVVINLLSNAVKFTPSGSVTVRARRGPSPVEAGPLMGDADGLLVAVADTGLGIAADDRERVFEQFSQAGDTLSDGPRGTGLGLPISRQIVEHHGGRLWLESEVGAGSTFSFWLPAGRLPAGDEPASDRPAGDPPQN